MRSIGRADAGTRCLGLSGAALLVSLLPRLLLGQQCGGEERWAVKVGSDSRAAELNLNPVTVQLHELVALPRPQLPPTTDDDTRLDEELTVYVVEARLLKFKPETGQTGDGDYHLVITDDTLQFSKGGHVSPHSFIAEIVDPECAPGRHGDPSIRSHFQDQLEAVWAKFEQRFPSATGGWNDAEATPVRITGVGFYDRPHGQTGRARNGIEIHPVLDITFGTSAPLAPATVLLRNPGFEGGADAWKGSDGVVTSESGEPARSGSWKAWLGGYGASNRKTLYQEVTIPSNVTTATLAFYLHISTEEQTTSDLNDTLTVQVRSTGGNVLASPAKYSNLQAGPGFNLRTVDLSAFRGQTVRIYFLAKEDDGSLTSFVLDDLAILSE